MKKLLIIAAMFLLSCKEGDIPFTMDEWAHEARRNFNDLGIPDEDTQFKYDYTTPGGQKVKSVVPIPSEFLGYADEGAQRQIERFQLIFPTWQPVPLSERRILVIEPSTNRGTGEKCVTESDDPGSPCLYVRGIKAAGTVLGLDDLWQKLDLNPPVILAHQQYQNWSKAEWWKNTIHNENEHMEGFKHKHIDPSPFYHYQGEYDSHPWTWPPVAGLMGARQSCFVE